MTSSFRRLLTEEPQQNLLETAVEDLGARLFPLAADQSGSDGTTGRPDLLARQVRTARGTYRLFGTFFRQSHGGSANLHAVVAVAPPSADLLPSPPSSGGSASPGERPSGHDSSPAASPTPRPPTLWGSAPTPPTATRSGCCSR